jgi:hypothetical protein
MLTEVLIIAVLTAFICGLAVEAGIAIWRGLRSKSWPSTAGEIVMAVVNVETTGRGGKAWIPCVNYRFSVQGREIEGNTIRFGARERSLLSNANKMIEGYVVGGTHAVYFDAADPRINVLEPGVSVVQVLGCLMAAAGTAVGVFAIAVILIG